MTFHLRLASLALLIAGLLAVAVPPRAAEAGVSDAALALAGPLAEQFGVPAGAVTGLLESGISLESVTQLLLVSQSSDEGLGDVADLYRASGSDVDATAEKLGVEPSAYSKDKAQAAIAEAKSTAAADATDAAKEGAGKALDDALGGLGR